MKWVKEYTSSLKNIHAEEFLDVLLFRPIAFVIVKVLYSFPLTPNHYSLMSFIAGVLSGYYFYFANFRLGAFFFFLFAVLDCCDGMQARMKKNGSEFGRFVDGLVDYSANIICYITLAIGFSKSVPTFYGYSSFWLVILAGFSKAIHSILYDHFLMEYLSYSSGKEGFAQNELEMINRKLEEEKKSSSPDRLRILILTIYKGFTSLQSNKKEKVIKYDPKNYIEKNLLILKMWSLIGPAVHILMLVIAFLLMKPEVLFVYAIGFGNLWMLLMFIIQKKINNEIKSPLFKVRA